MLVAAYDYLNKVSGKYVFAINSLFNQTAREVCEGQQLDMDFEKRDDVKLDEYLNMITLKTSVLIAASLKMGAIIGGAVIVVAVAALLTILVVLVRRIDKRVVKVRDTLRAAAANTSDTALIAETAARVDAVLAEGLKHHLFLGRVLDKVRS